MNFNIYIIYSKRKIYKIILVIMHLIYISEIFNGAFHYNFSAILFAYSIDFIKT